MPGRMGYPGAAGRARPTPLRVYETMNGPNEFMVIGNLKNWDRIGRLGEIRARTLITVGKYDELSPTCAETLRQGIVGSHVVEFERSSHTAHLEETDAYLAAVRAFLADVDSGLELPSSG